MALLKNSAKAALLIGATATGLTRGITGGRDISSSVYELATGNPNIDQDVFGTKVGLGSIMSPIPTPIQVATGGGNKYLRLAAAWQSGMINKTTVGDHLSNARTGLGSASAPRVDGSLVFGQYNSRFG